MATELVIPTVVGSPDYTLRTRLDGREYNLRFLWNQREGRWYLNISDDSDTPIVSGQKLVCNWPLLRFYQYDKRVPPGDLRVISLSADGSPPGWEDLEIGRRCQLVYFPKTDL